MALRRNLEGLASLFPPSQRPYTPWLKDDLVRPPLQRPKKNRNWYGGGGGFDFSGREGDLASLLQGLGETGTTGPLGGPSSVIGTGSSTSPPGSILDLLGGMGGSTTGPAHQGFIADLFGGGTADPTPIPFTPDIGTVPPPPPTAGPRPVDQGYTIGPLPGQFEPQPPSKAQRIRQLKAQVRALEDQIRQIMLQIRELKGGGRSWTPEAPPGIGMNPPPTPPTPWKPPLGG